MRQILCKEGVQLKGLPPALAWIFYALDIFVRHSPIEMPEQIVITSIYDGIHVSNSRHYRGEAIDIRSKNFQTVASKQAFRSGLENALNSHPLASSSGTENLFRVLLEQEGKNNEHFHVQVKKGVKFKGV